MASLGSRLKAAIRAKNSSPAKLAADLAVGSGLVSKWLNDKQEPNAESLAKICVSLGISGHWLLTEMGGMEPPGERSGNARAEALALAKIEVSARVKRAVDQALTELGEDVADVAGLLDEDDRRGGEGRQRRGAAPTPRRPG